MRATAEKVRKELRKYANKKTAKALQWFFKTGPGEYAEGDKFIGVKVPHIRSVVKKFKDISLKDAVQLLKSGIHEERMFALLTLVSKFNKANEDEKKKIFTIYLKNSRFINNWDLVDLSAPNIIGAYIMNKDKNILYRLARSKTLWERRIAVLGTFYFIKYGQFDDSLKTARMLLNDKEDLIHKAVGWMLREIGKRALAAEEKFLRQYYKKMPRTMLRYAIEKFPEPKRKEYLLGKK